MNSFKPTQLSVFGFAQEAEFNSKSIVYSTFRTIKGMTPKQYESALNESE